MPIEIAKVYNEGKLFGRWDIQMIDWKQEEQTESTHNVLSEIEQMNKGIRFRSKHKKTSYKRQRIMACHDRQQTEVTLKKIAMTFVRLMYTFPKFLLRNCCLLLHLFVPSFLSLMIFFSAVLIQRGLFSLVLPIYMSSCLHFNLTHACRVTMFTMCACENKDLQIDADTANT